MRKLSAARLALALAAAGAAGLACGAAADANYPTKPIRFIVPFSAGATNDILARMIGQHMSEVMGKTVIVDNRTGAEGLIGTELAVRAAPDGYTLVILSSAYVMNPAVRKVPYDPLTSLEFVTRVGTSPTVLCAGPALQATSVKELVALAKARPGQITLGTSGGFQHFASALFRSLSGQDFNIVIYKGAFPAMMDVIGGQLHATIIPIVPSLPHLRSGRLKALAAGSIKRSALLPDLPTIDEAGIPGYDAVNVYTVAVTGGTPQAIVKRLYTVVSGYLRQPDTQQKLTAMGAEVDIKTGDEIRKGIPAEIAKWTKVARAAGMGME